MPEKSSIVGFSSVSSSGCCLKMGELFLLENTEFVHGRRSFENHSFKTPDNGNASGAAGPRTDLKVPTLNPMKTQTSLIMTESRCLCALAAWLATINTYRCALRAPKTADSASFALNGL